MITSESIDRYNRLSASVLEDSSATIWSSVQSLVIEVTDEMEDGLHIPVKALKQAAQAG
jgi:hypothetical protein